MVGAWRHPAARTKPASSLRLRELSKAKLAVLQPRWREQHHEGARGAGRYAFGLLQAGDSQLNRSNFWDAPTLECGPSPWASRRSHAHARLRSHTRGRIAIKLARASSVETMRTAVRHSYGTEQRHRCGGGSLRTCHRATFVHDPSRPAADLL